MTRAYQLLEAYTHNRAVGYMRRKAFDYAKHTLGISPSTRIKLFASNTDTIGEMTLRTDGSIVPYIRVNKSSSVIHQLTSVLHESTHMKQLQDGILSTDGVAILWKGKPSISIEEYTSFTSITSRYKNLPFEREAFRNSSHKALLTCMLSDDMLSLRGKDSYLDALLSSSTNYFST